MSTAVLLGVDVGSTRVKCAAFGVDGRQIAFAALSTPWRRDGAAAELDADDVLGAVRGVLAAALGTLHRPVVLGVGVTGMAETGFLLDETGRPLAPAPAWFDPRADAAPSDLALDPTRFAATTGLPLTSRCTAVKTRWLTDAQPDARVAHRFASLPEWVVSALGGESVCELSLASRTGWLDVVTASWLPEHQAASGVPALAMPVPVAAGIPAGRVGVGPLAGAVLTVAGHDHVCAAVGVGATAQTDLLDSIGTGEALVRWRPAVTDRGDITRAVEAGLTVGWHVTGGQSVFVGLGTGAALQRILALLGVSSADAAAVAALDAAALRVAAADVPRPAVDDLTTNEWPRLAEHHPAPVVWHAALETAARRAHSAAATVARFAGPAERIVLVGGWTAGEGLRRTRAAAFGGLAVPQVDEAAARGAALLAGLAAGQYRSIDEFPTVASTWVS